MVLSTGTITMSDLQTEYGGSNPISLSEYYADGTYVPIGADSIPSSSTISLNIFRGKNLAPNYITTGIYTYTIKYGITYYYYGWLPSSMGSINNNALQYYYFYYNKYGVYTYTYGSYTWGYCYYDTLSALLQIRVDNVNITSGGPDYFRVGTQVIARTAFTRTYTSPYTYLSYSTTNPFPASGKRVRVSNYYTSGGELPG